MPSREDRGTPKGNPSQMGNEKISTLLFRFSFPATVGMLVMATYNIVDTIFVGRLGSEAIAALSVAFPIQMLLGAVGIGTGVGAASLISRSLGADNQDEAENAAGQVIALALIFGLVTALAGFFFLRPVLLFLGTTPDILGLTEEYMIVITSGSVMFYLIMIMNNMVRAEGSPLLSMKIMILSALVNIGMDPIFIFLLGMGVQGAAVATVLSKVLGVGIMLYHFFWGQSVLKLRVSSLRLRWETIKNVYVTGFPAMLLNISTNISLIIANNILAAYGHVPIAVMGLIFRLKLFAIMPIFGISQGLLPIIGFNYGAEQPGRIREALLKGAAISSLFITLAGVAFFAWPTFFLGLFSSEPKLLVLGEQALRIMVLMFPLIGIQIVSIVFFQAIGKGTPSLLLSLLREMLLFIPLMLAMSNLFGLVGVWSARPVSDLVAFLLTFILISRELKRQGIPLWGSRRPQKLENPE